MKIGVPKEIKTLEFRVGLVPPVVHQLTVYGHKVFVESGAGAGIGQSDDDYRKAGAEILPNADEVFKAADMIVKVKEPQAIEIARLKPHHVLFTYLHLAPDPEQTKGLMKSGATCIAYETITDTKGRLPLLAPMSRPKSSSWVVVCPANMPPRWRWACVPTSHCSTSRRPAWKIWMCNSAAA
jgi:alanine dehydrogenase